jgi:hypothetical protein
VENPHLIEVNVSPFNSESLSLIGITVTGADETEGPNFTKGETVSLDNISLENFLLKHRNKKHEISGKVVGE